MFNLHGLMHMFAHMVIHQEHNKVPVETGITMHFRTGAAPSVWKKSAGPLKRQCI